MHSPLFGCQCQSGTQVMTSSLDCSVVLLHYKFCKSKFFASSNYFLLKWLCVSSQSNHPELSRREKSACNSCQARENTRSGVLISWTDSMFVCDWLVCVARAESQSKTHSYVDSQLKLL